MARGVELVRAHVGGVEWAVAQRPVPADLRPYVESWTGYAERAPAPVSRRELPGPRVVVIVELGAPLRLVSPSGIARFPGGFVAGLDDGPTVTEHDGQQRGVQLNLTPQGARRLFGVPLSALARQVVSLEELWPRAHLAERLASLPDWGARLELLESALRARLAEGAAPHAAVAWAVERIFAAGGSVDVGALTRALGYSPKHVVALFHEHVGLTPKVLARVVRFDRLRARLSRGGRPAWAALAAELGYCDQAHLGREVRALAGVTPTALAASLGALGYPGAGDT